jgi:hypothetical protein
MIRWLLATALTAILTPAAPAGAECTCRYAGQSFQQGQTVCIRVGGSARLARCDMALNNSSWTFLKQGCPTALRDGPAVPAQLARAVAGMAASDHADVH